MSAHYSNTAQPNSSYSSTFTNPDFYPTPVSLIRKMVEPIGKEIQKMQVLEPSAGSGVMLDYLTKDMYGKIDAKNVYAIESDPELVYTLQGKGYKVIDNDFLTYSSDFGFDLILMNPPFSNGDEHLLKAWDVLRSGHIVCLLNERTINNPHTERRKLLAKIIADHGSVESVGAAFENATRQTKANVVIVRLEKKAADPRFDFDFGFTPEQSADFSEEMAGNSIAMNDIVGAKLRQYELTKAAMVNYLKAKEALTYYSQGLFAGSKILEMADEAYKEPTRTSAYNSFVCGINKTFWLHIISKMNIAKIFTHGVRENLTKFQQAQGSMTINRENINSLINMLIMNRGAIMDAAIVDVFDNFTQYHKENRCHVEGWKTNSEWKVNRKVILPSYLDADHRWSDYYKVYYSNSSKFEDIDKVMCWLTGKDYDDMSRPVQDYPYRTEERQKKYKLTSLTHAISQVEVGDNSLHESEFFMIRCFKKGTIHLTFKDEFLWATFNQRACKGKNWLGK